MASYAKGNLTVNYEYNEYGLRTQKVVNNNGTITTYNYTWSDDKLTHQTWGNNYLHFYYDYSDEIIGFEYFDGTEKKYYTYLKNTQGDVFGIADEDGSVVAQYAYDAWGKLKSATSGIGLINPIRYRGYYYDTEISMYYLQSRYYDQNIGRFVNSDAAFLIEYLSDDLLGVNLYTYCNNSVVVNSDYAGFFSIPSWTIATAIDVAIIVMSPAVSGSFTVATASLGAFLKWSWSKQFAIALIKKAVPKFRGILSKSLTLLRKIIWRVTGYTLYFLKDWAVNKFFEKYKIWNYVSAFLSYGGFTAFFLDVLSDGKLDSRIKIC